MTPELWLLLVFGTTGLAGVVAAFVAWRKLRPETNQIIVTTAKDLVLVQTDVIKNLREEVARLNEKVDEFEQELAAARTAHEAEILELRKTHAEEILALRNDLNAAIAENIALRKRVRELEHPTQAL